MTRIVAKISIMKSLTVFARDNHLLNKIKNMNNLLSCVKEILKINILKKKKIIINMNRIEEFAITSISDLIKNN
jgi:hypothetical protein